MGDVWYALGYGGHGVALATYLGNEVAGRITGETDASPFEGLPHPTKWYYRRHPWFLPVAAAWYGVLDRLEGERLAAGRFAASTAVRRGIRQPRPANSLLLVAGGRGLWRSGGAHRIDGARGGGAAAMGDQRALSRPHRGDQPPPRPQLDRDDDARRLRAAGGARGSASGRRVHCPGRGPHSGHQLGLRRVWRGARVQDVLAGIYPVVLALVGARWSSWRGRHSTIR